MTEFKIGDEVEVIDNGYWDGLEDFTNSRLQVKEIYPNAEKEDCILCKCLDKERKDLFGPISKFRHVSTEGNKNKG
jgi:hypothetical protein